MGRYEGDTYYSGGAYYFSTLAAAEFCYRAAGAAEDRSDALALRERGDGFLRTVQRFTPEDGALSEQFDQATGAQTSARHLAWSYAAFISSITARQDIQLTGG
jgi:glucoamylase